ENTYPPLTPTPKPSASAGLGKSVSASAATNRQRTILVGILMCPHQSESARAGWGRRAEKPRKSAPVFDTSTRCGGDSWGSAALSIRAAAGDQTLAAHPPVVVGGSFGAERAARLIEQRVCVVERAAHHHALHLVGVTNVLQRIAVDDKQIGELAGFDRAEPIAQTERV